MKLYLSKSKPEKPTPMAGPKKLWEEIRYEKSKKPPSIGSVAIKNWTHPGG
jgi:hypothetical protein